ncbi:MAG: hypothetical protein JW801_05185 [Bacteroidales bacterium]|nr:hypothetical protein [Bacteroidales bacterium]
MKITKYVAIVVLALSLAPSYGQKTEVSMKDILEKADTFINIIEFDYEQEIVRMEIDIIRDSKETFRHLSDGYEYGIFVFGDYRIKDLDVNVYTFDGTQWVLEAKDEEENEFALLSVTPERTQQYKIEIKAYSFNEGYDVGHYGLIIFHE